MKAKCFKWLPFLFVSYSSLNLPVVIIDFRNGSPHCCKYVIDNGKYGTEDKMNTTKIIDTLTLQKHNGIRSVSYGSKWMLSILIMCVCVCVTFFVSIFWCGKSKEWEILWYVAEWVCFQRNFISLELNLTPIPSAINIAHNFFYIPISNYIHLSHTISPICK